MYILAYKDEHDPAACILKDGKLIAAAEEERFVRVKHASGFLPKNAIAFCLREAGIEEHEVEYVVYAGFLPLRAFFAVLWSFVVRPPRTRYEWNFALRHVVWKFKLLVRDVVTQNGSYHLSKAFPNLPRPVAPFSHHACHAASAFLFSPYDESLVITWDGKGEGTSVTVSVGKGARLQRHTRKGIFESLGFLYSNATQFLGFAPNDGEYKVMGLAPYGKAGISLEPVLRPSATDDGYYINSDFVLSPPALVRFAEYAPERLREGAMTERHQDFAYALQDALEQTGLSIAKKAVERTPSRYLCLAGGVALNIKLNRVLQESGLFEGVYVQPASGDSGLVFGAAGLWYAEKTGKRPLPLEHLYLGTHYSDESILSAFEARGLTFKKSTNIAKEAATCIAQGEVIAWFQGRMEFGPRALGARSVLADPSRVDIRDHINEKIKFREEFRPFCPSILEEHTHEYLKKDKPSPFMVLSFEATEKAKKEIAAVVHVDGTIRPQSVGHTHPVYRQLIEEVYAMTGVPAVLNTSLNIRGEPIIDTPEQLVDFFLKTNVDAICAGNYIALRKEQDPARFATLTRESLKTEF